MNEINQEAKDLVRAEDGKRGLVVGNRVFSPHTFSKKIPDFSAREYVFLRHYSLEVPLEEAAAKAELAVDEACRFLERPKVQEWLADRALKAYIKQEWEVPGKAYQELDDVYEGRKTCNKSQIEALKMLVARVAPEKRSDDNRSNPSYTFNFGVEAVREAFKRQAAIETEISKGGTEIG